MGALGHERLARLIDAHAGVVGNYLRRRAYPLSLSDLEDLVEETFVVIWRRLGDVPSGVGERPWIIGVARNVLHNAQRANRRRRRHEALILARGEAPSAEDEAIADISGRAALMALRAADREILALHYWDGLDLGDLSLVLGVSENVAGTRLSRAKARFVEQVRSLDELGTSGTAADMERMEQEKRSP
jgi:RNA polymerase sigma-70 factor (ECF subfamily)